MQKNCNCSACKKGFKIVSNNAFNMLQNNINVLVINETENFATRSTEYDKNRLSILMMFKRKLIDIKTQQITNNLRTTPVK